MSLPNRAALTLVLGAGALPAFAQSDRASGAASSGTESPASAPPSNAQPGGGVEWFVAGVAVGIVLTLAWIKIRGGGDKDAAPA